MKKILNNKIVKEVWDLAKSAIFSIIVVLLVTQFVLKPIRVDGSSMYPTLENNQVGFSNIMALNFGKLERFDIVIVYVNGQDEYFVKRVIALPNETIEFRNDVLYINGQIVIEPFLNKEYIQSIKSNTPAAFTNNFGPITLADDEVFLLGDNRPYSSDSRRYGPFKISDLVSKDAYILFPIHQMRFLTK